MKLTEKIEAKLRMRESAKSSDEIFRIIKKEGSIDFAEVEKGLLAALSKIDSKVAKDIDKKWGMDQVWGISGSLGGMGSDKDHEKFFEEIVALFGEDKRSQVKDVITDFDIDYNQLEDGTQPW